MTYALEGSAFIADAAVQWLRDGLGIIESAPEIEPLARQVDASDGVYFVPALAGLGAPYWDPEARGLLCGLTRGSTRAHVARATLEGIAHEVTDLLEAMAEDLGKPLARMRVDGGAAANELLMTEQAKLAAWGRADAAHSRQDRRQPHLGWRAATYRHHHEAAATGACRTALCGGIVLAVS